MPGEPAGEEHDGVREFVGVLRRRWVALVLPIVLTPLLALAHSSLQQPLYTSSADVLVTSGSTAAALSELPGLSSPDQPERNATTQVELARLPRVAQRVIGEARLDEDPESFLARSNASAKRDADLLSFTVEDGNAEQAERLATIYARAFTNYRNTLDLQAIRRTRTAIERTLARLAEDDAGSPAVLTDLRGAVSQLEAAEAVHGSSAILVQPGVTAQQIAPNPMRDLLLALVLGVILGVGIAFLVERLDTRIREPEEVDALVGVPLLGEIPRPPLDDNGGRHAVAMLEFPFGAYAESVRKLRANLEFANLDVGARSILVTSTVDGEGKTTVACDLALALARSGRTVALCDLDPRSPSIDRVFRLGDRRGLVEVAFGIEPLESALVPIHWTIARSVAGGRGGGVQPASGEDAEADDLVSVLADALGGPSRGHLHVLPFGRRTPPTPGDFVGSGQVRHLVAELARTHDIVILDTPPLFPVSDALTISEYVDAALIVCGLETSRRPALVRLRKLVAAFPAHVLGLVVTGVPAPEGYGPTFVPGAAPDTIVPGPAERAPA